MRVTQKLYQILETVIRNNLVTYFAGPESGVGLFVVVGDDIGGRLHMTSANCKDQWDWIDNSMGFFDA